MNKGIISALSAYLIWGLFPIYWKWIANVPALQIVAHRILWSFVFVAIVVTAGRTWTRLRASIGRRTVLIYLLAGVLLTINWLTYVYAVNEGFVLEASLGYFINPLVSVLLGVVFLREKLRPWQWAAVALAGTGVLYMTITHGSLPWIAIGLALSFGLYGFIKKQAPLGSLDGLALETATVLLPALGYLIYAEANGSGSFGHVTPVQNALLVFTGVVTAIPLLLFSYGARRIPLSTVGLLQFITPTMQFLLGVFAYHEAFTPDRVVGFSTIWLALIIYTAEGFLERRRQQTAALAH